MSSIANRTRTRSGTVTDADAVPKDPNVCQHGTCNVGKVKKYLYFCSYYAILYL